MTEADGSCFHCRLRVLCVRFYVASDRRIYVGSFEEFGYFEQNDLNLLEYHSLKEQVKGFDFHNDEIWTIVEQGGNIIFQSFGSYFIYDGKDEGSPLP